MDAIAAYVVLFAAAFLAATIFPAQSEAVLLSLLTLDRYPALALLTVASAGNVLGSCANYVLGRFLAGSTRLQRLVKPVQRQRAESWYRRYGKWSLLASWVPVVGDPLTIVAGALREPFAVFLVLVTFVKAGRYFLMFALHQTWTE
jgi:membrane protein YqaA with SNARE-associated domain